MTFFEKAGVDPVTFEILRHRLFAINDEAAATLRLVSGSPVANEAYDFNTGVMDAAGGVFVLGIYIGIHSISLEHVVKYILAEYGDNPGINPGDMFLCNDPYYGAMHQSDVVCVSPVFCGKELVAWTGAAIHQVDVGGSVRGSQCSLGAESIFQEATPIPPIKLVEKGVVRKDLKQAYLRHSRMPQVVELDLRAKIAANNTARRRIEELVNEYGVETVRKVIAAISDYTELMFRERLKDLPDGSWKHHYYMEYQDKVYPCHMTLTKKGEKLVFDFTGTAKQAPAVINCTLPGARGGILVALLQYLCYDIPWSPAGIERTIEVIAEPGTLVNATWPAGMGKSTTGGIQAAIQLSAICLAKMLAASEKYEDRLMAGWIGGFGTQELFGADQRGDPFGAVFLESMVGGSGASSIADGVDTGGMLHSIACCKANVETYEFRYPVLYLYSRQQTDSGGAGKFRGGMGFSAMYMSYGVKEIPWCLMLRFSPESAEATGVVGGYPGGSSVFAFKRKSNIRKLFEKGSMPGSLDDIEGKLELPPAAHISKLGRDDVWIRQNDGGGGYGDPL
ncbi:MAG: hydantoinase B/oxoprolinase family protein, partial [Dehalococcoidia bacterium]|nr:hydantoinase B/oxoprolinase family protein [Dehalococcoidia bacterium]